MSRNTDCYYKFQNLTGSLFQRMFEVSTKFGGPLVIFTNKFIAVGSNQVFSQFCRLCRYAILLEGEAIWQNRSAILNRGQQGFNIKFCIDFCLVWNEMQSVLHTKADAHRNNCRMALCCFCAKLSKTAISVCTYLWELNTQLILGIYQKWSV